MKVCRHCAEELPDEATVCPECHKDPAVAPAWAVPEAPHELQAWSFEDARDLPGPRTRAFRRKDKGSDLDVGRLHEAAMRMLIAHFMFHRTSSGWNLLPWNLLQDDELARVDEAFVDPAPDEDARAEAAMRRSEKLQAIGAEATFPSGVARIDGEFRSIRVAVTPDDFVLLDNWTHLDPETELARLPRESITDALIVDENGNEAADAFLDPIHELDTPEEERYAVVLERRDATDGLKPVWFLFRSGEPALECRDRYRRFITPPR
jgi:hypothetical protein